MRVLRLIVFGSLLFLLVLAFDLYPGLRGGAGWQWTYTPPESWIPVLLLALVLLVYGIGAWWVQARSVRLTLLWTFVGAILITYAVVGVRGDVGFTLFTRTVSPVQTGGSALAVRVISDQGVDTTLRGWTEVMKAAHDANLIHFTTSPPGQPLLHYRIGEFFDYPALQSVAQALSMRLRPYQCSDEQVMRYTRGEIVSAGLGLLMPLFAALAVFPLYAAALMLSGDSSAASRLVIWWAIIPTTALFAPTWNTLYPALCILSFALLLHGLLSRRMGYALLGGVVMSLTTFLNFAVLPILGLFGLFALGGWYFRKTPFLEVLTTGVWFGVGLLSVWVLFWFASGLTPFDILRVTFDSHRDLVQRDDYFAWLILHPYDIALFVGLPLFALAVWGMARALQTLRSGRSLQPEDMLAFSMGATLLIVNLLGLVQGENGRILSFYAPFLLLSGLRLFKTDSPRIDAPLFAVQGVAVLVMAAVLDVVPLDLNPQPVAPRDDIASLGDLAFIPADAAFTSGQFAGAFRLVQYRYIGDPAAQAITYEFVWEGTAPSERPYRFELVATAFNELDGEIAAEPFRWSPQGGNYLTPCWKAGERVRDVIVLPLPPVSMPVVWNVELRAVDERSRDVMNVNNVGQSLLLEPVKYP
jgi:hypothetical protein